MKAARLVVLVVAVAAGGVAALLAGRGGDEPPPPAPVQTVKMDTVDILVARGDINLGQAVSAQDLLWQQWPTQAASPPFVRRTEKPDAIEQLSGAIARSPFVAGEPIREAKLIKANGSGYMAAVLDKGMRAVSTEISPETGAGGFILPNDRVDVILSRRDREAEKAGTGEAQVSETILSNIRILAIDQTLGEKDGQKVVIDLPRDIKDVLVAEPKFANAVVRSTRRAYLIGVAVGQTNIYFFDAEGKQIAGFDVAVTRDLNGLRAMLHKMYPQGEVRVDG